MTYYRYQLFFCNNQRTSGKASCEDHGATAMREYCKKELKKLGIHQAGDCRTNTASCLGRCEEGPILVLYPEGIWYSYKTHQDIDEIISQHILKGKPVERLLISSFPPAGFV